MKHALAFAAVVVLGTGTAAFAQAQQPTRLQAAPSTAAADQVICEKEEDTGSRLTAHKICHTRSQWDQLRRDDRGAIERVQQQRSMSGH